MRNVYELKIASKTENLSVIGEFVEDALKKNKILDDIIEEVLISADEAATNIIIHSYKLDPNGYIRIKLTVDKDKIVLSLYDKGNIFNPEKVAVPILTQKLEDRKLGGLGIFLMKKFMDEVTYFFKNTDSRNENEVKMVKYIK